MPNWTRYCIWLLVGVGAGAITAAMGLNWWQCLAEGALWFISIGVLLWAILSHKIGGSDV